MAVSLGPVSFSLSTLGFLEATGEAAAGREACEGGGSPYHTSFRLALNPYSVLFSNDYTASPVSPFGMLWSNQHRGTCLASALPFPGYLLRRADTLPRGQGPYFRKKRSQEQKGTERLKPRGFRAWKGTDKEGTSLASPRAYVPVS